MPAPESVSGHESEPAHASLPAQASVPAHASVPAPESVSTPESASVPERTLTGDNSASPSISTELYLNGGNSINRKQSTELFRSIDDLLQNQEDFLGAELNSLFEAEANESSIQTRTAVSTARNYAGSSETLDDGLDSSSRTRQHATRMPGLTGRGKASLFYEGDNEDVNGMSSLSRALAINGINPAPAFLAADLSIGGTTSKNRFRASIEKSSGSGLVFNSPAHHRDLFQEMMDEGEEGLLTQQRPGLSALSISSEDNIKCSGFMIDASIDAQAYSDLELLTGRSAGSNSSTDSYAYSPGKFGGLGLNDEAILQSALFTSRGASSPVGQRMTRDPDAAAAALLGDLDSEGPGQSPHKRTAQSPQAQAAARNGKDAEGGKGSKKKMNPALYEMEYGDFMHRLSIPQCSDLRAVIAKFLWSVLGPSGNGTVPAPLQDPPGPDYVFHGTKDLEKRCVSFFDAVVIHIRKHPRWSHEPEEKFSSIRDCLEQHCMLQLATLALKTTYNAETEEDDRIVYRKVRCLQFLKPAVFDINPALHNDKIWQVAGAELAKINDPLCITPGDKNACIVRCAAVIFRALSLASKKLSQGKDDGSTCGADDFLPLFIWVVLRAQVPGLLATSNYIEAFLNPERLMGKDGYCLMNLRSAIMFIKDLTASSVTMDAEQFEIFYKAAQAANAEP